MGKVLKSVLLAAAVATLSAIMAGCNAAGCIDNQNSIPLAGFYSMASGEAVSVDSLAVWGVGAPGDSLLLAPSAPASQIYLPLRAASRESAFCFAYRAKEFDYPQMQDTVTLTYTSHPWFISEDCGAGLRYRIDRLTYTRHLIDSVGVTDSLVTNVSPETIRIYFRTSGPQEGPQE